MAQANSYWLKRLQRDRALADRAAEEVAGEVRRAYRAQYLQTAKRLEELYTEVQARGGLSRTKLWNYARWREAERELKEFCEAQSVIQREKITEALDAVFREVMGAEVTDFDQRRFILPYSPRAVIDTAWSGESFSGRVWRNTGELAERIQAEAQRIVMGELSAGELKKQLMRDFDVSWKQAERLVDTEVSYVLNKANLTKYGQMGVQKVTIVNLDVNTCDRCKALEGEVFRISDAPALPVHPRCHCSYCVPEEGDEAEVTASGSDLAALYAEKDVRGYKKIEPAGAEKAAAQRTLHLTARPETAGAGGGQTGSSGAGHFGAGGAERPALPRSGGERRRLKERALRSGEKRGIIPIEDVLIPRGVGAKGQNYDILGQEGDKIYHYTEGSRVVNVEVFAGYRTKHPLHEGVAEGLTEQFGGEERRWQHVKGIGYVDDDGESVRVEVHWFQCEGIGQVKHVIKKWLE